MFFMTKLDLRFIRIKVYTIKDIIDYLVIDKFSTMHRLLLNFVSFG